MVSFKSGISYSLIFFTLFFFSACGGSSGPGEPNDKVMDAGYLQSKEAIGMKIDSAGDIDWYGLPIDSSGYVKVSSKGVPDHLKLEVRFAKKQAWEAKKHKWLSDWEALPHTKGFRGMDTVHFAVRAKGDKSSKKSFKLRAEAIPELDEHEPNDDKDEAVKIPPNDKIRSFAFPKGDRDYFKVKPDSSGYLYATAQKVPKGIGAEIRFQKMGQGGDRLVPISGYRVMPAGASVSAGHNYFLEFGDDRNDTASRKPVDWKLEFVPQMDSTEPNARWGDAHPISAGDSVKVALFPAGDRDLFRIESGRKLTLEVRANGAQGVVPEVQLIKESEGKQENVTEWVRLPYEFLLEAGKLHFMILREKEDDGGDRRPFTLSFKEVEEV